MSHRATIFSCVRLYFLNEMEKSTDPDVKYSLTPTYSAIEINLAIWAGSLSALWPLIRQGRRLGDRSGTTSRYCDGYGGRYTSRRRVSGWVRTGDGSRMVTRGSDEDGLELTGRGGIDMRTKCKASVPGDSNEEVLAGGITCRRMLDVEVIIRSPGRDAAD